MVIRKDTLANFIEISEKAGIQFAKYTVDSNAPDFVEEKPDKRVTSRRHIPSYRFRETYRNGSEESKFSLSKYFVLFVLGRAYLLYEINEQVRVWVYDTEKSYRNSGYMTQLLKYLIETHSTKQVEIDTPNKQLRNCAKKLGINIYKEN